MPESKHILTSKIFLSAIVGVVATIAMSVLRHYGYYVTIPYDAQIHVTTIILSLIAWWRTRETKALHVKRDKKDA